MGKARPVPGDTFGCHRLVRELGRGATATVFEAVHEELGRRVALKVLDPALASEEPVRARFRREGRAAARVRHPHVVEVFDVGTSPSPYLVLELVQGGTLEAHLAAHGPLESEAAVRLFLPVVSALQHVHAAGIVHRDLKPANILLSEDLHGRPVPKVSDFGISKVEAADPLTRDHAVLGTVGYMAPEQLRAAAHVDGAADRWALGVVLLESVSGKAAFPGDTTAQRIRAVLEDAPVGLEQVPSPLRNVLAKLLAKSRHERFETDAELGIALAGVVGDEGWRDTFRGVAVAGAGATVDEIPDAPGNSAGSVATTSRRTRTWGALLLGVAIVAVAWMVIRSRLRTVESPAAARPGAGATATPPPASTMSSAAAPPPAPSTTPPAALPRPAAESARVPSSPKPSVAPPPAPPSVSVAAPTSATAPTAPAPVSTGALGAPILE